MAAKFAVTIAYVCVCDCVCLFVCLSVCMGESVVGLANGR